MLRFSKKERLAARVRNILLKCCPGFEYRWDKMNNRKFIWFEAYCQARKGDRWGLTCQCCTCMRDLTDTCEFGKWPQLGSVMKDIKIFHQKESEEEAKWEEQKRMLQPDILIPKIKQAMRANTNKA